MAAKITETDVLPPGVSDMSLLNPELLLIYAKVRSDYCEYWHIFVNEWDGIRVNNSCGYRTKDCKIGAVNSPHKKGLALDLHVGSPHVLPEVRESRAARLWALLKTKGHEYGIKRLEDIEFTPTWIHIDLIEKAGWKHEEGVYVFKP
jgi:hypothetical protein